MKKFLAWMFIGASVLVFASCASSAQKASEGGFKTVETPASELEAYKAELAEKDVTGVQTCALPISKPGLHWPFRQRRW